MTGAEKLRVPEKIAVEPEREKADWALGSRVRPARNTERRCFGSIASEALTRT